MKRARRFFLLLLCVTAAAACLFAFHNRVEAQAVADALEQAGVECVIAGEQTEDHFLLVAPTVIEAGHETIYVYQFRFTPFALLESATIGHNGFSIGAARVAWTSAPHFYRKGSTIIQYVGDDGAVLDALHGLLGAQFAGIS